MTRSTTRQKPKPTKPQQPAQPVWTPGSRSNLFDPNDLQNYIREPDFMHQHIRDPIPSQIAYRC
jgi:hypothetical protein